MQPSYSPSIFPYRSAPSIASDLSLDKPSITILMETPSLDYIQPPSKVLNYTSPKSQFDRLSKNPSLMPTATVLYDSSLSHKPSSSSRHELSTNSTFSSKVKTISNPILSQSTFPTTTPFSPISSSFSPSKAPTPHSPSPTKYLSTVPSDLPSVNLTYFPSNYPSIMLSFKPSLFPSNSNILRHEMTDAMPFVVPFMGPSTTQLSTQYPTKNPAKDMHWSSHLSVNKTTHCKDSVTYETTLGFKCSDHMTEFFKCDTYYKFGFDSKEVFNLYMHCPQACGICNDLPSIILKNNRSSLGIFPYHSPASIPSDLSLDKPSKFDRLSKNPSLMPTATVLYDSSLSHKPSSSSRHELSTNSTSSSKVKTISNPILSQSTFPTATPFLPISPSSFSPSKAPTPHSPSPTKYLSTVPSDLPSVDLTYFPSNYPSLLPSITSNSNISRHEMTDVMPFVVPFMGPSTIPLSTQYPTQNSTKDMQPTNCKDSATYETALGLKCFEHESTFFQCDSYYKFGFDFIVVLNLYINCPQSCGICDDLAAVARLGAFPWLH